MRLATLADVAQVGKYRLIIRTRGVVQSIRLALHHGKPSSVVELVDR
ncbi:MAG: hypothetical protein OJF52_000705 [Nitrospira sp.]|jgi:hypothetical protein|nr:MAG: hypothetical protein OJF52_000705 [Nitrospira sp.]